MKQLKSDSSTEVTCHTEQKSLRTVVIIPAYNEKIAVAETVLDYINAFPWAQIVVIDNNSNDQTAEAALSALRPGTDLLLSEPRQGKGYAVKSGLSRLQADIYVMTDADMTYPATDARKLYDRLIETRADMLVGNRLAGGSYARQNTRLGHNFGNALLTRSVSWLAGQSYDDVLSGLRVMSAPFVAMLDVRSDGFQLETEINLTAAYLRASVIEEPISYKVRPDGSDSKLSTFRDGLRILAFAVASWISFSPLQFFTSVTVISWIIAMMLGYRVIAGFLEFGWPYSTTATAAAAIGITGILSFFTGLSLHILGRTERRRVISSFLEHKRAWNRIVDDELS